MNRDALTLLLIGAGLYFLSRSGAGALAPGATLDYVPAGEAPLYGTPNRLFPFDYSQPTNLLPVNYEA